MRLKVIHRAGAYYRGTRHETGDIIEIDETAHNGVAEIRYLTLLKKVEPVKDPLPPVGLVAETRAPVAAPEPEVEPEPEATPEPEAEEGAPPRRRGYNRRDLRAED